MQVLVCDDADIITSLIIDCLKDRHSVYAAHRGDIAIDILKNNLSIDVCVVDLVLPDISGIELVKQLKEHKPDLKFVCISSYFDPDFIESLTNMTVLPKPFSIKEFLKVIEKLEEQ